MSSESAIASEKASFFKDTFYKIKQEVAQMMVGQDETVEGVLSTLILGGHVLLEGVPGLGKTLLVSSLSKAVALEFSRIQFTPDLMPADIQGTTVLTETETGEHKLQFQEGPIISNLVLADEINRATPKTQSALLEVMQEKQVTVGRKTIKMAEPYCVMATQNPGEQEGTYPLPEAQLDRFLFKLIIGYPSEQDYHLIIDRTTSGKKAKMATVADGSTILTMRETALAVPVPEVAKTYAIRLVMGTQPQSQYSTEQVNHYVELGASPRGIQALMLAAKVQALLDGRFAVSCNDVKSIALPVLRHRLVLNFHAQANKVDADTLIKYLLQHIPLPGNI